MERNANAGSPGMKISPVKGLSGHEENLYLAAKMMIIRGEHSSSTSKLYAEAYALLDGLLTAWAIFTTLDERGIIAKRWGEHEETKPRDHSFAGGSETVSG